MDNDFFAGLPEKLQPTTNAFTATPWKCPCGEGSGGTSAPLRCVCHDPMSISIPPGQHIHIQCPQHGDVKLYGTGATWCSNGTGDRGF